MTEVEPPAGGAGERRRLPGFGEMAARRRAMIADLVAARRAAGLSQTEVAARMGTSQSAVARLEAAAGDIRVSTLERYAAALGCSITWQSGPTASGGTGTRGQRGSGS